MAKLIGLQFAVTSNLKVCMAMIFYINFIGSMAILLFTKRRS